METRTKQVVWVALYIEGEGQPTYEGLTKVKVHKGADIDDLKKAIIKEFPTLQDCDPTDIKVYPAGTETPIATGVAEIGPG